MAYSKSSLAITLSRLQVFIDPKVNLEQYPTDSEVAAEVLWSASMNGDIEGKVIADLGCGTGILGIGAILLGAERVLFVDTDDSALALLKKNLESLDIDSGFDILHSDISDFKESVDVVLENPPFGTRERHIDKLFLEKAASISKVIYSFHKTSTASFVYAFAKDNNLKITNKFDFSFPLKATQSFHKKRIERIEVSCFRLERA